MDKFWRDVDTCCDKITASRTVDEVIGILNQFFTPSSGDAFSQAQEATAKSSMRSAPPAGSSCGQKRCITSSPRITPVTS